MDAGGLTSHTAIVVRSMGIPAVMGLKDISTRSSRATPSSSTAPRAWWSFGPDADMLAEYRAEEERIQAPASDLVELRDKPADHTRRGADHPAGQHRVPLRGQDVHRKGRRGHRPVPHGVPLPPQRDRADRGGALRGLHARSSQAVGNGR